MNQLYIYPLFFRFFSHIGHLEYWIEFPVLYSRSLLVIYFIYGTMYMASGPITWWEIDGETVETVSDFIFWGSKITADGDCSHDIKRRLLLGRKVMTNLDSILKSRDITLPTKVHLVKVMVFPVVMYGCESWTLKKAECRRIGAFELWYWRRLLRVPWTARRSNQSILKEINPEYSLEGLGTTILCDHPWIRCQRRSRFPAEKFQDFVHWTHWRD